MSWSNTFILYRVAFYEFLPHHLLNKLDMYVSFGTLARNLRAFKILSSHLKNRCQFHAIIDWEHRFWLHHHFPITAHCHKVGWRRDRHRSTEWKAYTSQEVGPDVSEMLPCLWVWKNGRQGFHRFLHEHPSNKISHWRINHQTKLVLVEKEPDLLSQKISIYWFEWRKGSVV